MDLDHSHLRVIVNQDGAAILDIKEGTILTLNDTGAYVWQALGRGEDLSTMAEALARETGEQLETVRVDVAEFIEALKAQDLLPG